MKLFIGVSSQPIENAVQEAPPPIASWAAVAMVFATTATWLIKQIWSYVDKKEQSETKLTDTLIGKTFEREERLTQQQAETLVLIRDSLSRLERTAQDLRTSHEKSVQQTLRDTASFVIEARESRKVIHEQLTLIKSQIEALHRRQDERE